MYSDCAVKAGASDGKSHGRRMAKGAIRALSQAVDSIDLYTSAHHRETAQLAYCVGRRLKLSHFALLSAYNAALLHDLGKIGLPPSVLLKPAALSVEEYALVKTHSAVGAKIVSQIPFNGPVAEIILQHHERRDGSGYPNQLKGDVALFEAQIVAVTDVYHAIRSRRPYRERMGDPACRANLESGRDIHFSGRILDALYDVLNRRAFSFVH